VEELGEAADVVRSFEAGHLAVAIGDEKDFAVLSGGDWKAQPALGAGIGWTDLFRFIRSANEENIGREFDEKFETDGGPAGANGSADIFAAGGAEHFIEEVITADDVGRLASADIGDAHLGPVFVLFGDFAQVGLHHGDARVGLGTAAGYVAEFFDGDVEFGDGVGLDVDDFKTLLVGDLAEAFRHAVFGGENHHGGRTHLDEQFVINVEVIADDGEVLFPFREEEGVVLGDADEAIGGPDLDEIERGGGHHGYDARAGGGGCWARCRGGCGALGITGEKAEERCGEG